jgi:hypothetical protein
MLQVAVRGYAELMRNSIRRSSVAYIRLPSLVTKTTVFVTASDVFFIEFLETRGHGRDGRLLQSPQFFLLLYYN